MSRIDEIFFRLRAAGRRGLMPFLCGGYPEPGVTARAVRAVADAGADIIEIGFPFSDPIADGPVIAGAMHEAIQAGATVEGVFGEVAEVRAVTDAGLVAMVSVSIVERIGEEQFVARAAAAGFDGFIFPDLPLQESASLRALASRAGLSMSLLVAPTTPPDRARAIAGASTGFVYLIARSGITGEHADAPLIADRVAALRTATDLPIACGFGISTAEQVRLVTAHADAAIVGSALLRRMAQARREGADPAAAAGEFVQGLAAGL